MNARLVFFALFAAGAVLGSRRSLLQEGGHSVDSNGPRQRSDSEGPGSSPPQTTVPPRTVHLEERTHRFGADLEHVQGVVDVEACANLCLATPECRTFSYVHPAGLCALKSAPNCPNFDANVTSGVLYSDDLFSRLQRELSVNFTGVAPLNSSCRANLLDYMSPVCRNQCFGTDGCAAFSFFENPVLPSDAPGRFACNLFPEVGSLDSCSEDIACVSGWLLTS